MTNLRTLTSCLPPKGEITALLGQNGAGKTTILGMLTGAYAPTAGGASVCGLDLKTQMPDIRRNVGICLQHDCLFPRLTVREHVQFFSRLKGQFSRMSREEAEEHVDQVIKDLALFEKRNTYAKHLSGGMKRKLCVAIAFCGDSSVVLLDEPTSGMDPFSRRLTWNVIRQYRQNRCIVLTTHFMDEADVLGDRIAMLGQGRLRCVGSPLFLKKRYGVGYQLTIEKQHTKQASYHGFTHDRKVKIEDDSPCDQMIRGLVEGNVPSSHLLHNVGTEMIFQLPLDAASQFVPLFDDLDKEIASGNVSSYGIGITTLEEVFLLVARGGQDPDKKTSFRSSRLIGEASVKRIVDDLPSEASTGTRSRMLLNEDLTFRHIRALFSKRAANFRRDKKAWCFTTILPSVFVLAGFLMFKFIPPERDMETLPLTLDDYNTGVDLFPSNPLVFNAPGGEYECQPALCAYSFADSAIVTPDERYHLCGSQAHIPGAFSSNLCSIADSENVMDTLTESDGVNPIPAAVSGVLNVRTFRSHWFGQMAPPAHCLTALLLLARSPPKAFSNRG
jgi:ABC-type multidrug transport system ATPase subunit